MIGYAVQKCLTPIKFAIKVVDSMDTDYKIQLYLREQRLRHIAKRKYWQTTKSQNGLKIHRVQA